MSDPSSESPGIVLVAEPHATRRDLIESCFQRSGLGMRLVHCPSLEEAQSNLVASSPDLVICGDGLSREEARDLISSMALRSDGIPVFVLEDPAIGTAAVDLVSAGADDCLRVCDETLDKLPFLAWRAVSKRRATRDMLAVRNRRLSSIAHDLRTPLTGVLALLDLIEGGADGALQPAQRARLLRVRSEIGRIVSLAEEIADLAVVEAGQLSLATTEIDLAAAVALARREAEPLLRAKAVELTVTMTADIPRVQGDPRRIGQILSALLASAASRAEGATLELIASVSGAMVEVILRESTRAIPIEALPPGFETGSGGSLGSSQTPRERISLAVARGLVELHGGTLSLGAGLSPGTLARFELPIAAVSQRPQTGQNPDLHPSA